jgi:RNA polymerase sigma-70 factor, ECF subfamily
MGQVPFDAIVAAHHAEIHRYLRRVTSRSAESDDLSQETFLRAYRAYPSLPGNANVRAWLFAIATNLSRNHYRAEKRRSKAHAAIRVTRSEVDGDAPDGETLFSETRALIEDVVDGLPRKQRMAFVLRKIHGLDYDAIGQSLQCSADTARAHVFQALRKVRLGLNGRELPDTEGRR